MNEEERLDRELAKVLGDDGAHELRAVLRDVDATWTAPEGTATLKTLPGGPPRQRKRRSRLAPLAVAASLALAFAVGTWLLAGDGATVDDYLVPYEVSAATRSGDLADATARDAAHDAYRAGDYAAAAERFGALDGDDPGVAFYRATALLLSGQPAAAAPPLRDLVARGDHLYVEQARYYLGLAYAKAGRVDEARQTLAAVPEGAFRYGEARELLALLE